MTDQLWTDYLDRYESVQEEIHQIRKFDESTTISTISLGRVNMSREDAMKAQGQFVLTDQSTTIVTLLNDQISKYI